MTIYEEIGSMEEDAIILAKSKSALSDEKEYYRIRRDAFREVLEMFGKRKRPETVNGFYAFAAVVDFLPPEHTK